MLSEKASKAHPENLNFFPFHSYTNATTLNLEYRKSVYYNSQN